MTPDECFLSLLDSLRAETSTEYAATLTQCAIIGIAIQRCLTHERFPDNPRMYLYRPIRVKVLSRLCERELTTSRQLTWGQARRLIERLYGMNVRDYTTAKFAPLEEDAQLGIQFAASGEFEKYYAEGKFLRPKKAQEEPHD